ncbi:hypothetical protein ACIRQY_23400 [Streptomyces sp. NPDC101490]|uniref:hypothetical protein n=1 Tax=Streptomyces sp. NPDC101490 TaxID=3366143 RepID=UPI0037FF72F1
MDSSKDDVSCGLCEQPPGCAPEHHGNGMVVGAGNRVRYVIVELRGATACYQAVDDPSRTGKTSAAWLAHELGTDLPDLLGRHYTCRETPAEYGVIQSGFELA